MIEPILGCPCGSCRAYYGPDPEPEPPPDIRAALAECFKEYADLALSQGNRIESGIWDSAARIAHDFVIRPK